MTINESCLYVIATSENLRSDYKHDLGRMQNFGEFCLMTINLILMKGFVPW